MQDELNPYRSVDVLPAAAPVSAPAATEFNPLIHGLDPERIRLWMESRFGSMSASEIAKLKGFQASLVRDPRRLFQYIDRVIASPLDAPLEASNLGAPAWCDAFTFVWRLAITPHGLRAAYELVKVWRPSDTKDATRWYDAAVELAAHLQIGSFQVHSAIRGFTDYPRPLPWSVLGPLKRCSGLADHRPRTSDDAHVVLPNYRTLAQLPEAVKRLRALHEALAAAERAAKAVLELHVREVPDRTIFESAEYTYFVDGDGVVQPRILKALRSQISVWEKRVARAEQRAAGYLGKTKPGHAVRGPGHLEIFREIAGEVAERIHKATSNVRGRKGVSIGREDAGFYSREVLDRTALVMLGAYNVAFDRSAMKNILRARKSRSE